MYVQVTRQLHFRTIVQSNTGSIIHLLHYIIFIDIDR